MTEYDISCEAFSAPSAAIVAESASGTFACAVGLAFAAFELAIVEAAAYSASAALNTAGLTRLAAQRNGFGCSAFAAGAAARDFVAA